MRTMLVWRVAMSKRSAWSRRMRPSAEAQSSARDRKSKRVCAKIGETRNVPQQDTVNGTQSAGRRPRFARQTASMQRQYMGETTVRQELIAHLNCSNRRRARGTQRPGGVRRFTCSVRVIFGWRLVMFLSFAVVSPESFPVESTRVSILVSTV